jgi:hypothetical protein
MNTKFKANMERHKRICAQLEKLELECYGGCVVDPKMPSHQIVCQSNEVVDTDNDFLTANPVIACHLEQKESKIQAYMDEQAAAHEWANRQ